MTNKDAWKEFGYPSEGWQTPKDNWKTSTQIKVIEDGDAVHIGFQYSKGWLDWLVNFLFCLVPVVEIHFGMWLKWRNVRGYVFDLVKKYRRTHRIYLYGHSQGGGFAQVIMYYLEKSGCDIDHCTSWGGLRVFGIFGRTRNIKGSITRYEHKSDIVPHVPFVIMSYKSVGERKRVGEQLWKWYYIFMPWKWYSIEYEAHTSYGKY